MNEIFHEKYEIFHEKYEIFATKIFFMKNTQL
jgi:hypothetical protein